MNFDLIVLQSKRFGACTLYHIFQICRESIAYVERGDRFFDRLHFTNDSHCDRPFKQNQQWGADRQCSVNNAVGFNSRWNRNEELSIISILLVKYAVRIY